MSLTRDFPIYRDTLLAHSGSTDLGGGNDEHLPIGMAGSYNCKAALKFTLDYSGMTNIVSARLYMKTTTKTHALTWGSSPTVIIERLDVGNFTENSGRSSYDSPAGSGWSTSASDFGSAAVQPGPDNVNWTPGNAESTWYSVDITTIVKRWGPTAIPGCSALPNYGILIRPSANAASETIEFYSRKASAQSYIRVTYDSNTAPNAPTNPSPASGSVITNLTPTLAFLYDDPQNDASSKYHVQVATDAGFTSLIFDSLETALVQADNTVMSVVETNTLTRGATYYWRAATLDAAGLKSAWSATWNFTVNTLPVATLTEPSATGRIAKVDYDAGSGWTQPRLVVDWSYSDAQGQAQTQYEIDVRVDSGGSPGTIIVNTVVVSSDTEHIVTQNIIENTRYHIRVRVYDGLEWSNWSGYYIVRARWGYTVHTKDVRIGGVPPKQWSVPTLNAPTSDTQSVIVEYASANDAAGAGLSAYQASLATVPFNNFVRYRVWFMTWGASPAALPSLADITIRISGQTIQPERWLPNPVSSQKGSIELADRVFGTQSLRIDGDGVGHYICQQVRVEPGENYILQTRVRSIGNSGAKVYLADVQNGLPLTVGTPPVNVQTTPTTADTAWSQRTAPIWNSGTRSVVWVICYINGATGTVGLFDGLKMERGQVSSPWTPGLVGVGVAIDSGGVQIDASNNSGSIFRLRAQGGQVIELGATSLVWQNQPLLPAPWVGTTPPAAPTDGQLWWDTGDVSLEGDTTDKGTTFPVSPAVDRLYFRTDIGMQFRWSGAHWLCTCAHQMVIDAATANIAATTTDYNRTPSPQKGPGIADIWWDWASLYYFIGSGTALSASHRWDTAVEVGTAATIVSKSIQSGANGWRQDENYLAINALMSALYAPTGWNFLNMSSTKTGTPGNLYAYWTLQYRLKAT